MTLDELDSPAVVVDLDRLERNIAAMGERAAAWGVALRPHIKTHKSRGLTRLQLAAGAAGVSAAKLDEAAAMAEVCDDVFVAYPVATGEKAARAADLAARLGSLSVGLDHGDGIAPLAAAARQAGRPLRVVIEVDCGLGRCGVDPSDAGALARLALGTGVLEVAGVFTHAGQAYRGSGIDDVVAAATAEVAAVRIAAETLPELGVDPVVSVGSTPTSLVDVDRAGITEIRPGNYVFLDRTQVHLGVARLDQCALTVVATVVSTHAGRAVIDAGSKVFALDRGGHGSASLDGYGIDVGTGITVSWLSEEHGVIDDRAGRLRVGDRLRFVPNHACVVTNLATSIVGIRHDAVEATFTIDAPGGGR